MIKYRFTGLSDVLHEEENDAWKNEKRDASGQFTSGGGSSVKKSKAPNSDAEDDGDEEADDDEEGKKERDRLKRSSTSLPVATRGEDGTFKGPDGKPVPEHIASLKLPPAWKELKFSTDPDSDLLAVGKDTKGRSQYVYSEKFKTAQAEAKFPH